MQQGYSGASLWCLSSRQMPGRTLTWSREPPQPSWLCLHWCSCGYSSKLRVSFGNPESLLCPDTPMPASFVLSKPHFLWVTWVNILTATSEACLCHFLTGPGPLPPCLRQLLNIWAGLLDVNEASGSGGPPGPLASGFAILPFYQSDLLTGRQRWRVGGKRPFKLRAGFACINVQAYSPAIKGR